MPTYEYSCNECGTYGSVHRSYDDDSTPMSCPKCNFTLYWDDGLNPSRTMSVIIDPLRNNKYNNPLTPIPWVVKCFDQNGKPFPDPNNADPNYEPGCIDCQNINALDCDKLRLARFIKKPCVTVSKGFGSGTLLNGSYMVVFAYAID